jgi:S-formylglutathione hydrolase
MQITEQSAAKVFGGYHKQFTHHSACLQCTARFAIFLPPGASTDKPVPVLYWLSGLSCTDENFMQKAGAFQKAAELGIAIVAPDTSPRGEDVPDDENQCYDFGLGAGFYLNATQKPWNTHYHMYDYVVDELPKIIEENFPVSSVKSIAGHSMGGHGALVVGIRNQKQYKSISVFSPVSHPGRCPWGIKAFSNYLGEDKEAWKAYDACELLQKRQCTIPILVDQGDADVFLKEQLYPEDLVTAAKIHDSKLTLRMQEGYDHSYFFISSFIAEHLEFHHKYLF